MKSTEFKTNQPHNRKTFLTKSVLRDALGLSSTRMVDQLMAQRKIPFIKLGHRTVRFDLEHVERALQRLEVLAVGDKL